MEVLVKNLFMSDCEQTRNMGSEMKREGYMNETEVSKSVNDQLIEEIGLAQAYVPMQNWENTMGEINSLACGTVFGMLVMPYVKGSSLERNRPEVCPRES